MKQITFLEKLEKRRFLVSGFYCTVTLHTNVYKVKCCYLSEKLVYISRYNKRM